MSEMDRATALKHHLAYRQLPCVLLDPAPNYRVEVEMFDDGMLQFIRTNVDDKEDMDCLTLIVSDGSIGKLRDFLNRWYPDAPSEPVKDGE